MAIEGSLADVSLADICQLLAQTRKTGCLSLTDRSKFGYIYFGKGRVIHASVLNRPDRLGELLVRRDVITRESLSQAMEQQARNPGPRLGEILVQSGALTEEELNKHILIQIEEAVYHLFNWDTGGFHFDPDHMPEEEGALLVSINAESLLLEGARRVDEWSQIEKKVTSLDLIFGIEKDPAAEEDVELTEAQSKVLQFLDGERTVEDVVLESGLVEFDVAKALYGLAQAGFVRSIGRRTTAGGDTSQEAEQFINLGSAYHKAGMLEDAAREYTRALEAEPANAKALLAMTIISMHQGEWATALEQLDGMPEEVLRSYAVVRNRALVLEGLERYEEALEVLEQAESIRGSDPSVLLNRAVVQLKRQDAGAARETFRQYESRVPAEAISRMYFAYGCLAAAVDGDLEGAVAIGRDGLGRFPEESTILVNMGVVLERRGELDAAEALYLKAVGQPPPPPQAHKNLGDLAYRRGDQAGAKAHFERAVDLSPGLGDDVYLKLGNIAYKESAPDEAVRLWKKALDLNPDNEVARTNLELLPAGKG